MSEMELYYYKRLEAAAAERDELIIICFDLIKWGIIDDNNSPETIKIIERISGKKLEDILENKNKE